MYIDEDEVAIRVEVCLRIWSNFRIRGILMELEKYLGVRIFLESHLEYLNYMRRGRLTLAL